MHQPYKVCQLLKLPLGIESIKAYGEHLLVGTRQGHLLMYSVAFNNLENEESDNSDNSVHVQLLRSNKNFSKKAILKLEAVPDYSILVALSDSVISVHDIDLSVTNFPVITSLTKTKGASTFALDVSRVTTLTGEEGCTVRLVVAVKRKLQFYYWKNRKFENGQPDINLPDVPRSLAWRKDAICIGYASGYSLVKMDSSNTFVELFPIGKNEESSVTLMSDERFALGKDVQTTFVDLQGSLALDSITWSDKPVSVAHDPPYLVASLSNSVEIRTESPKMTIQTVELAKPIIISTIEKRPGMVYVASTQHIWCLKMVPVSKQIPQLLMEKQFELALTLTNVCENKLDDKVKRMQEIQILYGFDLFCNMKFKEALDLFLKLDVDVSHVIGLYSELFPSEFRNQIEYPGKVPTFTGPDLEKGYTALVEYLTEVRHKLEGLAAKSILHSLPMTAGQSTKGKSSKNSIVVKSKKQLMQILDTTLLKCYLKINDSLVASLLRLKNNFCHQEETERALKKCQKYSELIIFYNTKGAHKKALALLQEQSEIEDSPLHGITKTVQYLQNLGPDHIDLVCEYAGKVLDKSPTDGLCIFIDDILEVESWPRVRVFDFLMHRNKSVVIPYLEHIIGAWKDTNFLFHNALILRYKDLLIELQNEAESQETAEQIVKTKSKLKEMLQTSQSFTAETLLPKFPASSLFEERALLLGSLGKHKEALTLYLYQVKDVSEALNYCNKYHVQGSNVYTMLYQLLVCPPDALALESMYVSHVNAHTPISPDISVALKLLEDHGHKVDLDVVLTSTPSSVPLSLLTPYLEATLGQRVSKKHQMQLLRGLMHAEHLQVQEERIEMESQKVIVDDRDVCPVCFKRFRGQTAIVRFPNGRVVHYFCQERAIVPNL